MTTKFKPMLAASLTDSCADNEIYAAMKKLRYPVIAIEKIDGIRALKHNGRLVSRTLKPIPSASLQYKAQTLPEGLDMELWAPDIPFQTIVSHVMSVEGDTSTIRFVPLDIFPTTRDFRPCEYEIRLSYIQNIKNNNILHLDYKYCNNAEELFNTYKIFEEDGKEGICFRTPTSPYKFGRSTLKEQYLVKLACAKIGEAIIIGFEEKMINIAPAKINALGHTERGNYKSQQFPINTLGALVVKDCKTDIQFNIGTGFDDFTRKEIWEHKDKYIGMTVSYQSKPYGIKDKPRCPSYRGIRKDW